MSVKIEGNKITMTRGDTLIAEVSITDSQGDPYYPESGDTVRFALKHPLMTSGNKNYKDKEPLIEKDIPINSMILQLDPEDTKPLDFGRYVYDIELTYADGRVDTFITTAEFNLSPEVH